MGNSFARLIAIMVIYISVGAALNAAGLHSFFWLFIFVLSFDIYVDFAVRRAHCKDFPFRWLCPRCKAKRKRFFVESADEDTLTRMVRAHNHAIHLEEY